MEIQRIKFVYTFSSRALAGTTNKAAPNDLIADRGYLKLYSVLDELVSDPVE
jgi:hypothetical protein